MKKYENLAIASMVITGVILFIYNYLYLDISLINVLAISLVLIAPVAFEYSRFVMSKGIEARFPDFLRDVSENIRSGMTLPQAIYAAKKNDYGSLTKLVKKISVQLDWGMPFDDVLEGLDVKSPAIKRTISVIVEAHRGGGNIADILDSVGRSVTEINKLKKERISSVYSQMVTGYIIFFVFLGVIVTLQTFLVPSLSVVATSDVGFGSSAGNSALYSDLFQWLILIQGVFSGLVIGKMAEGSITAGLKHSLILGLVGYMVIIFFI